eukprot:CAMPEP_0183706770 /NCGR_PEP_ID=MMETSP0737-20130205/3517_1 /TAXON_ID=385413 /ORGANISM="Thalassiosira miniscula, Strain CCMP1093" /LENGTH=122 /DNA_ID=CAMNT_0025934271 /DNA_START=97 /DNA_END=465 /DNA_ORIENTATION=+
MATTEKPAAEIDLRELSEDDLNSLQKKDPFMYHSIPSIHQAKLLNKEIDHSKLVPSENYVDNADDLTSSMVSRKSRISTECHMSVMMEELLDMDDEELRLEFGEHEFDLDSLLGDAMKITFR